MCNNVDMCHIRNPYPPWLSSDKGFSTSYNLWCRSFSSRLSRLSPSFLFPLLYFVCGFFGLRIYFGCLMLDVRLMLTNKLKISCSIFQKCTWRNVLSISIVLCHMYRVQIIWFGMRYTINWPQAVHYTLNIVHLYMSLNIM